MIGDANDADSPSKLIRIEQVAPSVVRAVLDRVEKRNALNLELLLGLESALESAVENGETRVFILAGAGPVFCSGMDLREAADPILGLQLADVLRRVLLRLTTARFATVAAVQGASLAGGAGLASACDFVVAESGAKIGYPEVQRGLVASMVAALVRRQVPERWIRELMLLGEPVNAERAREMGLVNHTTPTGEAGTQAEALAMQLLKCAPGALAETKQLLADLWPRSMEEDIDRAYAHHLHIRSTAEFSEGLASFQSKRPPSWLK